MNILIQSILVTFVVGVVGVAVFYFFWLKTRPKKQTWPAEVYALGKGTTIAKNKYGKKLIRLQDLRPFATDVLEKVKSDDGRSWVYRLQKLGKICVAPAEDCIEKWGKDKTRVSVLLKDSGATVMRKTYNKTSGDMIFDPLPNSRANIIMSEMALRTGRLQEKKDILAAISPWIVAGVCMLGLVAIAYVEIEGIVRTSDNAVKIAEYNAMVSGAIPTPVEKKDPTGNIDTVDIRKS